MASNAKFEVEIYGNTTKFENSLKGVNTALFGLRGEAKNLREALKLDPTNTDKMAQLQKNLQTQLGLSRDKATKLKQELAEVDRSDDKGQKKWLQLTRDLGSAEIEANKLEGEIKQVEGAIKSGSWDIDAKMDTKGVNSGIDNMKSRFNGLKEIAIGAFRQIGASAVSAIGNGLKGWVSDAMDTQKAMISLQNTMKFKGNGKQFQSVSTAMQKLAKDTNANTEDTLKLATTFIGLGDSADSAVGKTENLVKANQAFGGTGENLKGVVQAYGQMSAAGKVTAENINQLTDNNTALGSALKSTVMEMNPTLKQFGSFAGASEKGAISVEMLDKAMQKLGSAGGGAVTTIGDAWDSFNETLSLALLPTLDALTPIISGLIDKMSGWGESAGKALDFIVTWVMSLYDILLNNGAIVNFKVAWLNIKIAIDAVLSIIGNVIKSFTGLDSEAFNAKNTLEQTSEVIKVISEKVGKLAYNIALVTTKIRDNEKAMSILKGTLVVLSSAFATFKVAEGILGVINAFKTIGVVAELAMGPVKALFGLIIANPFVAIAVAIAALVAGLVYFFTQTKTGKKIWADFVEFLKSSWDSVVSFFSGIGQWFADLWNGTIDGAKGTWQGLVDWFSSVVQGIKDIFSGIGQWFSDTWQSSVDGAKSIWQGLIDFFNNFVKSTKNTFNAIGNFFTNLWTPIAQTTRNVWNEVATFFTNLWTPIAQTTRNVWTTVITFLSGVVQSIISFFQPLINFYQSLFNLIFSIINLVIQLILAAIRGLVIGIEALWNGIVGVVQTVWNAIFGVVNVVVNAIQTALKVMGDFINGVWQSVKDFFTPIFQAIGNFAKQIFQSIADIASSVWNVIKSVWSEVSNFYTGIFNAVRNTVANVFIAIGQFAQNAWNTITSIFSSIGSWFGGVFNSAKQAVSNALGALGGFAQNAWNSITGVFSSIGSWFGGVFNSAKEAVSNALGALGNIAKGAWDSITSVFSGVYDFFANAFGGVKDLIDSILGGISGTLDKISGAINGVSKTVSGMFKGSMVEAIGNVSLNGRAVSGVDKNSITNADNRAYNTFTINAGNQDVTALARAVKREIDLGRAGK